MSLGAADPKDPTDEIVYTFDFTSLLASLSGTPTVSSATVTATEVGGGTAVTVGTPTVSSPTVTVLITGGAAGTTHDITCTATLSDGQIIQRTGALPVIQL